MGVNRWQDDELSYIEMRFTPGGERLPEGMGTAPIDLAFLEDNLTVEVRDDGSVGVEMPLDFWGELGEFPQGEDWRITLRWTVAMPYEIVATNGTVSDDGREVSWVRDAALDAPAEVMYARTGPRGDRDSRRTPGLSSGSPSASPSACSEYGRPGRPGGGNPERRPDRWVSKPAAQYRDVAHHSASLVGYQGPDPLYVARTALDEWGLPQARHAAFLTAMPKAERPAEETGSTAPATGVSVRVPSAFFAKSAAGALRRRSAAGDTGRRRAPSETPAERESRQKAWPRPTWGRSGLCSVLY